MRSSHLLRLAGRRTRRATEVTDVVGVVKDRPRGGDHTSSDEGGLGPVPHRPRAWYEQHASLSGIAVADETGLEHLLDAALEKPLCGYAGPLTQINAAAPRHRDPCEGCVIEMERRLRGRG